jgi:hypothetical protein
MRIIAVILIASTWATAVSAQDARAPLPRVRLDPAARAVTQAAPKSDPTVGPEPAMMMERFVVKDRALLLRAPQEPAAVRSPFNFREGGVFSARNLGPMRMEVGMAPPREVLPPLKSPKTQVQYSFLNFWW